MHLDTVVSILVGKFAAYSFGKRREGIRIAGILLLLGLFLGGELAFAGNVIQRFVHVHIARGLVQQGARSVKFGLHRGKHVVHGREFDDGLAELLAILGISQSLVVGCLRDTYGLSRYPQTGTVHQRHHVLDQAQTTFAAKLSFGVLVHQFAGGRSLDPHLVFDTAYGNPALVAVVDEHRKTAAVLGAFLAAGQHQVDVGVAVGDKALYTVEQPATVLLAVRSA